MKKYKEEFSKFEKDRQELANAEKLFDLPITMYTEMQQMEKELKGLELIYALYERQKVNDKSYVIVFRSLLSGAIIVMFLLLSNF